MPAADKYKTRASLLERLRDSGDRDRFEIAWKEFLGLYTPFFHNWTKHCYGLTGAEREEFVTDFMITLLSCMKEFQYDPEGKGNPEGTGKFRAWLRLVTTRAAHKWVKARKRLASRPLTDLEIENLADRVVERHVVTEATSNVGERLEAEASNDWAIFCLNKLDGVEVPGVMEQFNVTSGAVYAAVYRVRRLIKAEMKRLLEE